MKLLAALICLASTSALAFEITGNSITLSQTEVATCEKGNKCIIVTAKELDKMVADAFKQGQKSSTKMNKNQMCSRDS